MCACSPVWIVLKLKCSAYRKVGVCSRVYYFWLFISLIAWGKKLPLRRLVWDRMLWRRLPEGSRESSRWDGWLESLMILRAFLIHDWFRCPEGREAHLQKCGGQFEWPIAELCGWQRCCFQTRRWCSQLGLSTQCRCRMIWGCWG